jgi:hypothetical protein
MFCSQARPDPVRRVPLFAWRLQIELQYLLDLIFYGPYFRPLSVRPFPRRRERRAGRLPDHAPVNAMLRCQPLYRLSGCIPQPDFFK